MNALARYRITWTVYTLAAYSIVTALYIVYNLTSNSLIRFPDHALQFIMAIVASAGVVAPIVGIFIIVALANISQVIERNIRAENIGLHQFNSGEVSSPQELFATGVDRCLEASVDPKELMSIMKQRYQANEKRS